MPSKLIETITSPDDTVRNHSINFLLRGMTRDEILEAASELDSFRRSSGNLYHRVRACLFLHVIYGYYLRSDGDGLIPFDGIRAAYNRDFENAIQIYLSRAESSRGLNSAVFSALADSYYSLAFKYLLEQVKESISQCSGNHLLFTISGLDDYPYKVPQQLMTPDAGTGLYPVGMDASPVRLDPSHSGWSDIFFLGMDFPEGARVVNLSVDLRIHGSSDPVRPPCECYSRFIDEPVIHLISVDLRASKKISSLEELFNYGNDYLSLLKAGVAASGIVPPCFENRDIPLGDILHKLLGRPGGIEVVTKVNGIPKGSRLAVSTTLLATVITRLMRFSGQIQNQTGTLSEHERRIVASRAILGEWLGGSGGGWQDSGGLWPGIKVIAGKLAEAGDPEHGISRGCLLPTHNVFSIDDIPEEVQQRIIGSMVLVHGGISQDVGPILEMVTGKYLLKYEREWNARLKGIMLFDRIVEALKAGNMEELGRLTSEDWEDSIQKVIPWVNNAFTDDLIRRARQEFGEDCWGFLMLGGMSGGGMAFIVRPGIREAFKIRIAVIMHELKKLYASSLPFIIDPVVYDFDINHDGIVARLMKGKDALMPEIGRTGTSSPGLHEKETWPGRDEEEIKKRYGFDPESHEHMRLLLKKGEIGLRKNRLPLSTDIGDVASSEIFHFEDEGHRKAGMMSLQNREAAVVTFAGGMGSRWTRGAAVVKPINPFVRIDGRFRTFIEIHLAKSRKTGERSGQNIQHVFTTSYLTHDSIAGFLEKSGYFGYEGKTYLSPGRSIGRRVYPMQRDLRFYWEEQLQQRMDENVQKVQDDAHRALMDWVKSKGEGEDYSGDSPVLRFNPPGHWYEIPNLFRNGVLALMLKDNPGLKYLLCHNIDTMGAYIDPSLLGLHIESGSSLTFEVTPRRIEDAGGGLAKINGATRLIEGVALPREDDEYRLSYYNTNTCWISIDPLLDHFGLNRSVITDTGNSQDIIMTAVHRVERLMPTYVTIKEVKHVWGSGQEDTYPVAQFEKLWGDMTALPGLRTAYISVPRFRGTQLKEPSRLDMWMNDGSFDYMKDKCSFRSARG